MAKEPKHRFIEEYANFKISTIQRDYRLSEEEKAEKIRKVDSFVFHIRHGNIIVDEGMERIAQINTWKENE
jgi:hypothetical protein